MLTSYNDVRVLGRGQLTWSARELRRLNSAYGRVDAWTLRNDGAFVSIWKRGSSQTRLNGVHITQSVVNYVSTARVMNI